MMYRIPYDVLLTEWQKFQRGQDVDESVIRPEILASWKNCRKNNVPNDSVPNIEAPHQKRILEQNAKLTSVATRVMHNYVNSLPEVDIVCSLTSKDGVVLFKEGVNQAFFSRGGAHGPGTLDAEYVIGTTAIALALATGKSSEVFGPEHWCSLFHDRYSCSSPISSSDGALIGAISITRHISGYDSSWPSVVEIMASAITMQLNLEKQMHELQELSELMSDAMILVDTQGNIIQYNTTAKNLLKLPRNNSLPRELLDYSMSDGKFQSFTRREVSFVVENKNITCVASCMPSNTGAAFLLNKLQGVRSYVAQQAGFTASYTFDSIKGYAPSFLRCIELAKTATEDNITTLLMGESGTGKELFAQAIHNASSRRDAPFISLNCGSIPKSLIQSELFGYAEGSFTGASSKGRPGKFELAHHGTIFLDEIGEMPLDAQVALLRVLQERKVVRIGEGRERDIDVRVIAATNRNLEQSVEAGLFRRDLFYRLKVLPIVIPPLRERKEDILLLARFFLKKISTAANKTIEEISPEVISWLENHSWPGNVRELENLMEGLVHVTTSSKIGHKEFSRIMPSFHEELPKKQHSVIPASGDAMRMEDVKREAIVNALTQKGGNINQAAAMLGLSRNTIYNKMKQYGITIDSFRKES